MEKIHVFDTTLRDGEQSPGASMTVEQKLEVAIQLSRLGIDIIEAGFPISSPHQFKACQVISENVKGTSIAALARAVEKDIDRAADAIAKAEHPRIHTFIATSPIHMRHKLNKEPDQVIEMAESAVSYARTKAAEVEFSPEDGTRSEIEFLCRIIERVIKAGAGIINIPDTVGYTTPGEFASFITAIMEGVPNMDKALLSVHCHNDLGLGVANTITAIEHGARQIEVTINGIGERAGNAALEEVVMALNVRKDRYPFTTSINTKEIYNTSRLVSSIIGFPIPRNKPIVGENAFSHEAGIHQDGMLKHRETYEIMTPESVGKDASNIVLGRHSGKHGFSQRLNKLGMTLSNEELEAAYQRFLDLSDRKKEVYDEDLFAIVSDELGRQFQKYTLDYFNILSGNTAVPTATVKVGIDGEISEEASTGDGPIDAVFRAIDRATGTQTTLIEYAVQAVTPGKQALGEVSVTLDIAGRRTLGRGASTDIIEASAHAYVNALNRYSLFPEEKSNEQ